MQQLDQNKFKIVSIPAWNSAQCDVVSWTGGEFGEQMHVLLCAWNYHNTVTRLSSNMRKSEK